MPDNESLPDNEHAELIEDFVDPEGPTLTDWKAAAMTFTSAHGTITSAHGTITKEEVRRSNASSGLTAAHFNLGLTIGQGSALSLSAVPVGAELHLKTRPEGETGGEHYDLYIGEFAGVEESKLTLLNVQIEHAWRGWDNGHQNRARLQIDVAWIETVKLVSRGGVVDVEIP